MKKYLVAIVLVFFLAAPAWATVPSVSTPVTCFGDASDGDFSTSSPTWTASNFEPIIMQYDDFTLSNGDVITISGETTGIFIYAQSEIVFNGQITATGLGYSGGLGASGARITLKDKTIVAPVTSTSVTAWSNTPIVGGGGGDGGAGGSENIGLGGLLGATGGEGGDGRSGLITGGAGGGGGGGGSCGYQAAGYYADGSKGMPSNGSEAGAGGKRCEMSYVGGSSNVYGGNGATGSSQPGPAIWLIAPKITIGPNAVFGAAAGGVGSAGGTGSGSESGGGGGGGAGGGLVASVYKDSCSIDGSAEFHLNGSAGGSGGVGQGTGGDGEPGAAGGVGHVYRIDVANNTVTVVQ